MSETRKLLDVALLAFDITAAEKQAATARDHMALKKEETLKESIAVASQSLREAEQTWASVEQEEDDLEKHLANAARIAKEQIEDSVRQVDETEERLRTLEVKTDSQLI